MHDWLTARLQDAAKATEGPYFTAPDPAEGDTNHANSGLAMIETGRQGDWPPAMRCEWPQAEYFAGLPPEAVTALLRVAQAAEIVAKAETSSAHDCVGAGCDTGYGKCEAYWQQLAKFGGAQEALSKSLDALRTVVGS